MDFRWMFCGGDADPVAIFGCSVLPTSEHHYLIDNRIHRCKLTIEKVAVLVGVFNEIFYLVHKSIGMLRVSQSLSIIVRIARRSFKKSS